MPSPRRVLVPPLACAVAAAAVWFAAGPAAAGTLTGALYRESDTPATRWVAANSSDPRTPVIRDRIASQPASHWLSNFNLSTVQSEVSGYVGAAAAAGKLPVLTLYGIPNRDCGGASAGGAPDLNTYQTWVQGIARGIGGRTTVAVLEPDSIALQTCLSSSEIAARNQALHTATTTLKGAGAKVYLDAGHSTWNSASEAAARLVAAGVADADGFYSNVSNFNSTASETSFGRAVISALAGRGVSGKRQVIDTSRNGGAAGDWCGDDNTDRRIGQYPTTNTGDANIDAYLWVKPPGEADGCRYAAGSFQPDLAYSLASSASNPPGGEDPPPSDPPPSDPPPSGAGCTAAYETASSWQGGFQGRVTVTAGSASITGWQVSWPLASGQSVTQVWGGVRSGSGSPVVVRNESWNGGLQPRATAQFGFIANGPVSTPALTCTAG